MYNEYGSYLTKWVLPQTGAVMVARFRQPKLHLKQKICHQLHMLHRQAAGHCCKSLPWTQWFFAITDTSCYAVLHAETGSKLMGSAKQTAARYGGVQ